MKCQSQNYKEISKGAFRMFLFFIAARALKNKFLILEFHQIIIIHLKNFDSSKYRLF